MVRSLPGVRKGGGGIESDETFVTLDGSREMEKEGQFLVSLD